MSEGTVRARRNRSVVVRLALAAIALFGIGATITMAAWQDTVVFEADATAGTFSLEGRVDTGDWAAGPLAIDLDGLIPGDSRVFRVQVRNSGTVSGDVSAPAGSWDGDANGIATCDESEEGISVSISPNHRVGVLAPGASSTHFTVRVTTGDNWSEACQGATGTYVVEFVGTTDLP